jgi:NADH-quinone oxidoreductase subunit M
MLLVLLPLLGVFLAIAIKRAPAGISTAIAIVELIILLAALYYFVRYGAVQESYNYIMPLGISFGFALTNITFVFALLTVIVFLAAAIANLVFIKEDRLGYNSLFMLAESAVLGIFLAENLFLLYLFWDTAIIIFFFMLFHFGGYDRRYAAVKFILYSIFSSAMLLIGIIMIYFYMPVHTFNIAQVISSAGLIPHTEQLEILIILMLAFMVKLPIFPFHSWAPDAYSESPAGSAMLLSGVLSKFGAYGMLLLFISLPIAKTYSIYFAELFAFSAIYAAFVAMNQKEIKRMLSYLSISEMGIIAFGISSLNSVGIAGALVGILGHSFIIALLFMLAFSIEKVFGTSVLARLKGLLNGSKFIGYAFIFGVLATLGLPLTSGFISDLLILLGSAKSFGIIILLPIFAILINGAYLFWVYERIFTAKEELRTYENLNKYIYAAIALLLAFIIIIGIFPSIILNNLGAIV